ncbi:SDR family oxidoreductase [Streptomyces violens]|uniref:SDR family oxidoreductase n=1 Tax=Streptomyces violens TaxID=66377 RepID=UPI0004C03C5E|nr:SDR family oxidoreductase [Streptomyces violens]
MKTQGEGGVVVITGASSGVGRACAEAFAARGWHVVLAARRAEELNEVARRCRRRGAGRALPVPTEVTDAAAVDRLAEEAVASFGRIDVWINNAAVAAFGALDDIPADVCRKVIDTDVMGYVYGARAALTAMRRQGSGTLINVSSVVGVSPVPYNAPYALAKAAVRALGTSLRQELWLEGHRDVHVCTMLPATMDTPFFESAANYSGRKVLPMAPVYTPERAARKALRLARSPRREAYVGPAAAFLALQTKLAPRLMEKALAYQMNRAHLSRTETAPDTVGSVPHPLPGGAVRGGWAGGRRTAGRRLATAAVLTGAAYAALRVTAGRPPLSAATPGSRPRTVRRCARNGAW